MLEKNSLLGYVTLFALADYIPVMNDTEIVLLINGCLPVTQELIDRWEAKLKQRIFKESNIFSRAYAKQR